MIKGLNTMKKIKEEYQRYIDLLHTDFYKVALPNSKELSSILMLAKGNKKMKEFARETGISEATFSRIINQKTKASMSPLNIARIAFHAEANNDEVFFALAKANGYISFNEQKMIDDRKRTINAYDSISTKFTMSCLIKSALFERGFTCKESDNRTPENEPLINSIPQHDLFLHVTDNELEYDWIFYCIPNSSDCLSGEKSYEALSNEFMSELSRIFIEDAWHPDLFSRSKISIVTCDLNIYHLICKELSQAKLNNWFSICYFPLNEDDNIQETSFPVDNKTYPKSLFEIAPTNKPAVSRDNDDLHSYLRDSFTVNKNEKAIIDKNSLGKKIKKTIDAKALQHQRLEEYLNHTHHLSPDTYSKIIHGDETIPDSLYIDIARRENINWKAYNLDSKFLIQHIAPPYFGICLVLFVLWQKQITGEMSVFLSNGLSMMSLGIFCFIINFMGRHEKKLTLVGIFILIVGFLYCGIQP